MLKAYGENGFTFLFFQQMYENNKLVQPFLSNLKQFSTGRTFVNLHKDAYSGQNKAQLEVWLFPNFGKSAGFCEPDAIVLYRGFSFWIEVETEFDLIGNKSAAEKALVQLLRFHYFSQVLKNGNSKRPKGKSHRAYMGPTIGNNGDAKLGVLRVAGHGVLQRISERLAESARSEMDHYVLLSIQQMNGVSKKDGTGESKLCSLFENCVNTVHPKVAALSPLTLNNQPPLPPSRKRFWYQYFNGDLSRFVNLKLDDEVVGYVPRKKG